jgi:hypothetical protein
MVYRLEGLTGVRFSCSVRQSGYLKIAQEIRRTVQQKGRETVGSNRLLGLSFLDRRAGREWEQQVGRFIPYIYRLPYYIYSTHTRQHYFYRPIGHTAESLGWLPPPNNYGVVV